MECVDDFRPIGDKNVSVPTTNVGLDGVIAGLVPLLLVPLDDGVPGLLLSVSCKAPLGGGDLDFLRDSDDPAAPVTREVARLDVNDFITASAITYDSANSVPEAESSIAGISLREPLMSVGTANASSPAGEPSPKRAVRPLSDEAIFT